MKVRLVSMAWVAVLTAWTGSALANLILNPGFETGDYTDWRAVRVIPGTVAASGPVTDPHSGTYAALVELPVGIVTVVDKDVPYRIAGVSSGDQVVWSFYAKKVTGPPGAFLEFSAAYYPAATGGGSVAAQIGPPAHPHYINLDVPTAGPETNGYTFYTYTDTIPSTPSYQYAYLSFANYTVGSSYVVDDASLTVVPEPSALVVWVLVVGLVGVFGYARRAWK